MSMKVEECTSTDEVIDEPGIEPGASSETMLLTTENSFKEFESPSSISEIQHGNDSTKEITKTNDNL